MAEKKAVRKFEEIAAGLLDGDKLKNFLDFNEFLKNNKMSKAKTNVAGTSWTVRYKSKSIFHFRAHKDSWFISYFKGFAHEKSFEKC
jgi:hypothetical protein